MFFCKSRHPVDIQGVQKKKAKRFKDNVSPQTSYFQDTTILSLISIY